MKPALSIIFFSTVSGTGYGMLAWFGVASWLGLLPRDPASNAASIALALALATAGLLASTWHLGRPERAWRAISQWRTSWLSREGLASLITYVPAMVLLIAWIAGAGAGPLGTLLALLAAAMAMVTVICTGMIYASLKPIRQWHNRFVLPLYLLLSLYSGGAWLAALISFWQPERARLLALVAVVVGVVAMILKLGYWRFIDRGGSHSSPESATGLGAFGKVRQLDSPHTQENYLTREMGFAIARKHARLLRSLTVVIGFAIPAILMLVSWLLGREGTRVAVCVAALLALAGLFVERWLFFAEATHTVVLYYGRRA